MANAKSTYLYIFSDPAGIKVGISHDPRKRRIQVSRYLEGVKIERVWALGSPLAKRAEYIAHFHLSKHRDYGEWFKCSVRCAVRAVNRAISDAIFDPLKVTPAIAKAIARDLKSMTTAQVAKKHKLSVGTIYKHCPGGRGAALMMK